MPACNLRGVLLGEPETASKADGASDLDEFSHVVVNLEGPRLAACKRATVTLTQKDRRFMPEAVVPVGSTVSFPNNDPIFHNVFSLSKVRSFDLGYYPDGQTRLVHFDKPGLVQVYCHLRADMSAAILMLDTAQWTPADEDGKFSLQDVPAGNYELVAWHRSAGFFRHKVTLRSGETLTTNLTIPLQTEEAVATVAPGSGR